MRRRTVYLLVGLVAAVFVDLMANIVAGLPPANWRPYLWISGPVGGAGLIVLVVAEVMRRRGTDDEKDGDRCSRVATELADVSVVSDLATEPAGPLRPPHLFEPPRPERNPYFTGRLEEMAKLEATLRPGAPTALRQAITGMGGVGKTELAIEYAHRRHDLYDVVFTVRPGVTAVFHEELRTLAERLGLDPAPDGVEDRVRRWLDNNERWLLIFDNVDGLDDVRDFLPRGGGHILMTSRGHEWGPSVSVVDVDTWSPTEAVAFFQARTGRDRRDEIKASAYVAEQLGHLPLALEQAAAYMLHRNTSYADYLRLYDAQADRLLAEGKPADLGYDGTVLTTWTVTLEKIRQTHPEAITLMELCAFMAPDAIPEWLFESGAAALPPQLRAAVRDLHRMQDTFGVLDRLSLARRRDGRLSVHRLVQHVVRTAMPRGVRRNRLNACLRLLDEQFRAAAEHVSSQQAANLVPHVLTIVPYALVADVRAEAAQALLLHTGRFMAERTRIDGALAGIEHAGVIADAFREHSGIEMARTLAGMAHTLRVDADPIAARACYERALHMIEDAYGRTHPEAVMVASEFALLLRDLGDVAEARRVLARHVESTPPEEP